MPLPKYGIVRWRDATSGSYKRQPPRRLTENLPIVETLGWLFTDDEGTVAVVQERIISKGLERKGEFTLIPKGWIVNIIELVEKENGAGSSTVLSGAVPEAR